MPEDRPRPDPTDEDPFSPTWRFKDDVEAAWLDGEGEDAARMREADERDLAGVLPRLLRGPVMPDPTMSDDERVLLEHRWAVRVNLPTDANHAAQVARRLVDVAAYAGVEVPAEFGRAVELLERFAQAVSRQVEAERAELERSDLDSAHFQRELERPERQARRERSPGGHP
jgi:hypothetical protein